MLRLLVHADDFGLSEKINDGIRQAHVDGVLTSASVMANGAAFDHAIDICRQVPSLDIGIHLTLVEERPVLPAREVPSLADGDRKLHRHATVFTKRYLQGKIDPDDVRRELDAQLRKVLNTGIAVSHVDSHQHIHMLPVILGITEELAMHYGIPLVRFPREQIRPYMLTRPASLPRVAQLVWLRWLCFHGRRSPLARTQAFAGFFFGGKLTKQHLLTVIEHLPESGTCEVMCHPGLADPDTRYAHWGYRWSEELDALVDPDVADCLRRRAIRLVSYKDLAPLETMDGEQTSTPSGRRRLETGGKQ